jgi:hypothetical protein
MQKWLMIFCAGQAEFGSLSPKGPAVREISRRVTSCDPDHVAIETWMSECV